jgi:hypothetical protein
MGLKSPAFGGALPCHAGAGAGDEADVGLAFRRSCPAHGTVCKEPDRLAVEEADGDLDVGFLLRSVEDAGGLVAGELGAWAVGPGGDVASAIAHHFRPIGSLISVPRRCYSCALRSP